MWRRICSLALLVTVADVARAQNTGDFSPLDHTQSPPAAVYLPESVLRSSTTEWRDHSELGIGVGAPDFTMAGSLGQPIHLADLRGQWVVMVFTQNRNTLVPLNEIEGDLRKAGVSLYGVCRDAAPKLMAFAEREQLSFVLLSDRTCVVSQAYRRYDVDYDLIRPGIVLLDPKGLVRLTLAGRSIRPNEVLQRVLHAVTGA
jgi:peroxiredoxin Q/BCP